MENQFDRTKLLIGENGLNKLKNKKILIFGVGGVGGFAVEALARVGIGHIAIVDNDTVNITNINRQLIALHSTIGQKKVELFKQRINNINPDCIIETFDMFFLPDNKNMIDFSKYDYIIDAIDTVTAKLCIIEEATKLNIPIISAMGAGNKLDPTKIKICDIYETEICPLAKVIRKECKSKNIPKLTVAYSTEPAIKPNENEIDYDASNTKKRSTPGSVSFVPSTMGLLIAAHIVNEFLNNN